jgi:dTMP kinase
MTRGVFIAFEGGEGSGKSFVSTWVVQELQKQGILAVLTREPGGSPFAEEIRKALLSNAAATAHPDVLFELFWLARSDHMSNTVMPAIAQGRPVCSDRFDGSTYAYQVVAQERPELKRLFWQRRAQFVGHHAPQKYIFLDVEPEVGLERAKKRGKLTHFDARDIEFHRRIRAGYLEFFNHAEIPYRRIDANRLEHEVRAAVLKCVEETIAEHSRPRHP